MERLSTGVVGLDQITRGGLLPRAIHLIMGQTGTGKTVLAQQIAYRHARQGRRVLFLTALSEPVESLISHAQALTFFEPSLVAQRVFYLSVFSELQNGGLSTVLDEIRRLVREHKADLVLLDGLLTVKYAAPSTFEFRRFLFDLNSQLNSLKTTSVLISLESSIAQAEPETEVVDGIILLHQDASQGRDVRLIEVPKLRSVPHLTGMHTYIINNDGLTVFPRLEAAIAAEGLSATPLNNQWLSSGVTGLDQLLTRGLPVGSATLVVGDPGAGKTLLGLSFLSAGARQDQAGVYLGFHETPDRLASKGDDTELEISRWRQAGHIYFMVDPLLEPSADKLAWQLLTTVKERGAKRVVIDGIDTLEHMLVHPERTLYFVTALVTALRNLDATAVMTSLPTAFGASSLSLPAHMLYNAIDNVVQLRYVEVGSHQRRLLSILKMRQSEYENTIYEFTISRRGLEVTRPFDNGPVGQTVTGRNRGRQR